jgi:hypothetical protein
LLSIACSDAWPGLVTAAKDVSDWQQVIVDRYPGEFARGLFHSDGYRGMNRVWRVRADGVHWYEYPRYLFTNESQDIMRLCCGALDRLEVEWRFARRNMLSVAKRDAVKRLDAFTGPKLLTPGPVSRG